MTLRRWLPRHGTQSEVFAWPDLRSFRIYRSYSLIADPNTKIAVAGDYVLQLVAIKAMQAQRLPPP